MNTAKKVAVFRYAEYNCAMKFFLESGLEVKCVLPPPLTGHTVDIGTKNSPDFVCTPFKTVLGSQIEALEAGADTLVTVFGLCKLGYYGELEEQILCDLGYDFEFINLSEYNTGKKRDFLKAIKRINPNVNFVKLVTAAVDTVKMVDYLDEVTGEYYQNCGFEMKKGEYRRAYNDFLSDLYSASSRRDIDEAYSRAKEKFGRIPTDKPKNPVRIGIVGELYTAMDAFSNLEIERKLADMGVEVHRWMNMSNRLFHYAGEKSLHMKIRDLCRFEMGPTSTANIWCAKDYAERGFDGIIHIKSANCTPEIDIMPVLQNISLDKRIPILYLTYDTQTSDVGLMTRLEAFYDMISMRKEAAQI